MTFAAEKKRDGGRRGDVETADSAPHRDGRNGVADGPDARPEAAVFTAEDPARGAGRRLIRESRRAARVEADEPDAFGFYFSQGVGKAVYSIQIQKFDRAGRGFVDGPAERGAVGRFEEDPVETEGLGAPANGAEILRVGHAVDRGEDEAGTPENGKQFGEAMHGERLCFKRHALMNGATGDPVDLAAVDRPNGDRPAAGEPREAVPNFSVEFAIEPEDLRPARTLLQKQLDGLTAVDALDVHERCQPSAHSPQLTAFSLLRAEGCGL